MRKNGFTLIELLLVLALTGAVLTLSTHTFKNFAQQRLISQPLGTLIKTLRFARATAIGSRREITVCPSTNGIACTGQGYEHGWIVFSEHVGATPGQLDPGERLLATRDSLDSRLTLRANTPFASHITFRKDGRAHSSGRFVICANGKPDEAGGVFINHTGRLRPAATGELTQCLSS